MTQLTQGITIKPYSVSKEQGKGIYFAIGFKTDNLKAPFKFIKSLYKKSVLNDFTNIFSSPLE